MYIDREGIIMKIVLTVGKETFIDKIAGSYPAYECVANVGTEKVSFKIRQDIINDNDTIEITGFIITKFDDEGRENKDLLDLFEVEYTESKESYKCIFTGKTIPTINYRDKKGKIAFPDAKELAKYLVVEKL
jgi:hypothetical protein